MGKSYLIGSGKGGTGKTQTTLNLAYWAAKHGKKVAVIDGDLLSSNIIFHLDLPLETTKLTDFIRESVSLTDLGHKLLDNLTIIPSDYSTVSVEEEFVEEKLVHKLKEIIHHHDFTLIDCSPGIDLSPKAFHKIGSEMIVVSNPEAPAVIDSVKTIGIVETKGIPIKGIILNRTKRFKEELTDDKIIKMFDGKEILGKVPEDLYLPKSTAYGQLVSKRHPLAPSSIAYRKLASKIFHTRDYFEPTLSEQLKIWMKKY